MILRRQDEPARDIHVRMIDETNAFLSWALAADRELPRIPRERVDRGGFDELARQPGGKALIARWWAVALSLAAWDRW